MNTEHLPLFTKVEDGLPDKNGMHLVLINGNSYIDYYDNGKWEIWLDCVTHWLDLSKLTTKERAVEFALEAVEEEKSWDSTNEGKTFVQQNKNEL